MKHVYMSLDITTFFPDYAHCVFYEGVDEDELVSRTLTLDEARKLQWELVKAGAVRTVYVNRFDPHISTITITYWARH